MSWQLAGDKCQKHTRTDKHNHEFHYMQLTSHQFIIHKLINSELLI